MPRTLDIRTMQEPDSLATAISEKAIAWENARTKWYMNAKETLENLYATSTRDIYNQTREFDNSTHIPKLTQIRDMLVTFYIDAIFSLPDYVEWEPYSEKTVSVNSKNLIKALVRQMLKDSGFKETARQLIEDYVDHGNAFVTAVPVTFQLMSASNMSTLYTGPKAMRINPLDILFDPFAVSFERTPKIIRTVKTLGELIKEADELPEDAQVYKDAVKKALDKRRTIRNTIGAMSSGDAIKDDVCNIAGCGSWSQYYNTDTVELLTFYGDLYDIEKDKMYHDARIVIMDRTDVLLNEGIPNHGFGCNIFKAGWRDRKDNLWSMSPLDNIKGMQFMIDFLENKRADIFNYISNPMFKVKGDAEMPEDFYPGCTIGLDNDSDIQSLAPDATVLQADLYIDRYLTMMEEMAGTPREAMGFRTPGEKTAFEISQLNTASSRLFNDKTRKFEEELLEPLITLMLRIYLSDKSRVTRIRETTPEGATLFRDINIADLSAEGKLVAVGSSTYTEKARMAQTIQQIYNTGIASDPLVFNNFDPDIIATSIAYCTGLDKFKGILRPNARSDAELQMAKTQEINRQMLEETQVRGMMDAQQTVIQGTR